MTDLTYMIYGMLFVLVTRLLFKLLLPPKQTVDPNCPHCRGIGYDASGYACTCIKESP
jgi:hypothetical protein